MSNHNMIQVLHNTDKIHIHSQSYFRFQKRSNTIQQAKLPQSDKPNPSYLKYKNTSS